MMCRQSNITATKDTMDNYLIFLKSFFLSRLKPRICGMIEMFLTEAQRKCLHHKSAKIIAKGTKIMFFKANSVSVNISYPHRHTST